MHRVGKRMKRKVWSSNEGTVSDEKSEIIAEAIESAFSEECDCGSTEGLSKHISTWFSTASLGEPKCAECRKQIERGVDEMYREIQPWYNPIEVQREICRRILEE